MTPSEADARRESSIAPLTVLVRGMGAEAGYLSLNRGEGGQNLIGAELGEALGNTMVVLEGVRAGDRVITSGATLVLDGQPVRIIP